MRLLGLDGQTTYGMQDAHMIEILVYMKRKYATHADSLASMESCERKRYNSTIANDSWNPTQSKL